LAVPERRNPSSCFYFRFSFFDFRISANKRSHTRPLREFLFEELFRVGRGSDELSQAQNRGGPPRFAVNFIDARPGKMTLVGGRFLDGQKKFHLNPISKAVKGDVTRTAGMMQAKAMAAHRKNGGLQFEDKFVG